MASLFEHQGVGSNSAWSYISSCLWSRFSSRFGRSRQADGTDASSITSYLPGPHLYEMHLPSKLDLILLLVYLSDSFFEHSRSHFERLSIMTRVDLLSSP